ncbi:hypothetical protein EKL94_22260, partial [Stenotrophomonas maltophilia]
RVVRGGGRGWERRGGGPLPPRGRRWPEVFPPGTPCPAVALERVAQALAQRGVRGPGRVRQRKGSALLPSPELQRSFLRHLES